MLQTYWGFDQVNNQTDIIAGPLSGFATTHPAILGITTTAGRGTPAGKALNLVALSAGSVSGDNCLMFHSYPNGVLSTGIASIAWKIRFDNMMLNINNPLSTLFIFGLSNGTTPQVYIALGLTGRIQVFTGTPGSGTLLGEGVITGVSSTWNTVAIQATIASSATGSVIVQVNGVQVLHLTNVITSSDSTNNATAAFIGAIFSAGQNFTSACDIFYVDDLYLADTTGSGPYNAPLGDVKIVTQFPNANGTYSQFSPLSGTNWQMVSETAMDGLTTYNHSTSPGTIDTYTATALPYTPATIYAASIKTAVKDDVPGHTMAGYLISGASSVAGTSLPVLATFSYLENIWLNDPNTSTAWSVSGVNAAQFGYEAVS